MKTLKIKHFYINAELGEGIPNYDFVVKAESKEKAEQLADEILVEDYPDFNDGSGMPPPYSCDEVTAIQLLDIMTLN